MGFDYYTLKRYAEDGSGIGNWNGKRVFSCSARDLKNKGTGAFYILYDDDNKIVGREGNTFYCYGNVNEKGVVNEFSTRRNYYKQEAPKEKVKEKKEFDGPIGDVKLGLDVEATLRRAREMTVADLLEGFDYGLDVAKS